MALTVNHKEGQVYLGEKSLLSLAQDKSFSELIFLLLSEREPSPEELSVFELILNLSIDHGPDTPSAKPLIENASKGETIGESMASGVREINDVHGGAQEALMPILYKIVKENVSADDVVKKYKEQDKKLPGFGHRLYKDKDPRAELIIKKLEENGLGEKYISAGRDLEKTLLEILDKKLPLNVDGAIAIALCTFDFPSELGKAVFTVARIPGLCAHFVNNRKKNE